MSIFHRLFFCLHCLFLPLFADDIQSISGPKELESSPLSDEEPSSYPDDEEEGDDKIILHDLKGIILVEDPSQVSKATLLPGRPSIDFKGFQVPGDPSRLVSRLWPFLHRPLTQQTINLIKREIVLYYRSVHHPVMMVFVPEQNITDGILKLVVIESKLDKLGIKGNKHTPKNRILKWIRVKPQETIDEAKLLQDISWINRNPYRSVNVLYSPGERNGTTNIDLQVRDQKPWRLYVGGDNTGSKYTGESRWFAGINVENALFPDNLFSYQFTSASEIRKFQSHTLQYVAPLPWRNTLSIFGGLAYVHPHFPGMDSRGKSYQASARYEIPLWFTYPSFPQQLTLGFDFKGTNNNIVFGQDNLEVVRESLVNLTQFVFGYHWNRDTKRNKMAFGTEVFWSPGEMISHESKADYESLNPGAKPNYAYWKIQYAHEYILPQRWSLNGQIRLQFSNASLIASEQFALGGYNTVRGYPERVENGDNAVCINGEIHTPSFTPGHSYSRKFPRDALFFLFFLDYGYGWDHKRIPGFPLRQTLLGIGGGVRYRIASYFQMRLDLGVPLHEVYQAKERSRLHFSAVLSY